ncbi:hypothetical protein [Cytobacillus praedii]|uniref:Uncharacterized protein n=1 Tax=Cytobacillus praedii TaxID=1742358 RepID=A0A4R1B2B4_9BACI|nr:hypothetical protein [Cytobacillus praedii]TCJ05036.1 hypothetical protein E0Y62_07415 [Cytobacillus praedii]
MAEITASAYQDLRNYIKTNWQYIVIKSDKGLEILRIKTDDPRVTWLSSDDAQIMTVELRLTGLDFTTKPIVLTKAEIYKTSVDGVPMVSETFMPVTLEVDADKLTITINIQVPKVI